VGKFPYVVQLAFVVYNDATQTVEHVTNNYVRVATGVRSEPKALATHGITDTMCAQWGVSMPSLLDTLETVLTNTPIDLVVCHNVDFDTTVMRAEIMRVYATDPDHRERMLNLFAQNTYCTMRKCIFPTPSQPRPNWLTLNALHQRLFSCDSPFPLHDALSDVLTTLRCFVYFTTQHDMQSLLMETYVTATTTPTPNTPDTEATDIQLP
jgi:DNA polymerase III epsilon subunit-like protein